MQALNMLSRACTRLDEALRRTYRKHLHGILVLVLSTVLSVSNLSYFRFLKAAENNHLESQLKVGSMLSAGTGVEKNEKEGFNWYLKAAQAGLAEVGLLTTILCKSYARLTSDFCQAQNKVGLAFRTGSGVVVCMV